jgi:hypothetical protein
MRGQQPSTPDLPATRTELRPGGSMTHSRDPSSMAAVVPLPSISLRCLPSVRKRTSRLDKERIE